MSIDIFSLIYFNLYEVIESWEEVQLKCPILPVLPLPWKGKYQSGVNNIIVNIIV